MPIDRRLFRQQSFQVIPPRLSFPCYSRCYALAPGSSMHATHTLQCVTAARIDSSSGLSPSTRAGEQTRANASVNKQYLRYLALFYPLPLVLQSLRTSATPPSPKRPGSNPPHPSIHAYRSCISRFSLSTTSLCWYTEWVLPTYRLVYMNKAVLEMLGVIQWGESCTVLPFRL